MVEGERPEGGMPTFRASSSVLVVGLQVSEQQSSRGGNGGGYIRVVLFVDGGFRVGNKLSSKFLH